MADLHALFRAGQRIFVGGSSNEPTGLLEQLQGETLPPDLEFIQFPIGGLNNVDFTAFNETASLTTFFMTPALRDADPARLNFLPMQMRWVFDYLASNVDVALLQVARDRDGVLRLGPNVDFVEAVLRSADVVIAELNTAFTAPAGSPRISPERIDCVIETNRPLTPYGTPAVDEVAAQIGTHVAGLIRDGDCLQTGIGAIPAAIALNARSIACSHSPCWWSQHATSTVQCSNAGPSPASSALSSASSNCSRASTSGSSRDSAPLARGCCSPASCGGRSPGCSSSISRLRWLSDGADK